MAAEMTTAEVLTRAREMVDACWYRDHRQGGVIVGNCPYTAIYSAYHAQGDEPPHPAEKLFRNAIGVHNAPEIWRWNDAPGRTKDEVLAAFDRAIDLAKIPA